jgi:hypothetical protein
MLIQLSKGEMLIKVDTLKQSISLLESIFPETSSMLEYIATEPGVRPALRILEELRRSPVLSEEDLVRKVWRMLPRMTDWKAAITLLVASKLVLPVSIGGDQGYSLNVELDTTLLEFQRKELLKKIKESKKGE